MSEPKTHIAIVVPGGIGTGENNEGVPVLEQLIQRLSVHHSITVFSLFKVNTSYSADTFEMVSIHSKNYLLRFFYFLFEFQKHHKRKKFKILHGFWTLPSGLFAVIISKLFRVKSIVIVLGGDAASVPEINYGELRRWHTRKLVLWSLRNAGGVITLTHYLKLNLQKAGLTRQVKVIPWGIDISNFLFNPKPIGDVIRFLNVGNLEPVKDQITALKCFSIIAKKFNARLIIIGTGSLERELKKLALELKIDHLCEFIGRVPYSEMKKFYHEADVLLHTSLSEGQSEVVTEAMSCGLLVSGTSVGLIFDLPDYCVSVECQQYESLANATIRILKNHQEVQHLRENGHRWSRNHSIDWTVDQLTDLIRNFSH
ncbi:MAG TPA: hypothetical protein DGG95_08515 [Cytophagales bacterium]|nr:hypothetical protein [Cytophagales bacterium]